jgi:hypothetical protein
MGRLSPEQAAAKYAQRAAAASGDYVEGVNRVNRSPGQAAAAKFDKWRQGVQDSQEKWRSKVAAVSLDDWKQRTVEKGGSRYAAGVQASSDKYLAHQQRFGPVQDRITEQVRGMPDTTLEQRLNRMTEQARRTAEAARGMNRGGSGS